jgi:hypothetical protein
MRLHKDLTPERWFKFSIFEQLANVGMDIERTIQWKKCGKIESSHQAFERAMELLDLTIADPKNVKGTRKELVRVREVLKDYFVFNNEYSFTDEFWQKYFYDFNYALAISRGK